MTLNCTNINLKQGSTGDTVKELQTLLQEHGLYGGKIDGDYGTLTTNAVKEFQKNYGLLADGWFGPVTCQKMNSVYATITTTENGIITTGWKTPTVVKQDARDHVINTGKCYDFVNLEKIKQDNDQYAYIPTSGGVDLTHSSPVIYCSGYNFNIPVNAHIEKISVYPRIQQATDPKRKYYGRSISELELLKLKTGTSTTDKGAGNSNLPTDKSIPYKKWSTSDKYTVGGSRTFWNLPTLGPKTVNSSNFGCVFQCKGTIEKGWNMPAIARLNIKIDYTLPTTDTTPSKFNSITATTTNNTLDLAKPDTPTTITITYKHIGDGGSTPILVATSNDLRLSSKKQTQYTIPTIQVQKDTTEKTYTQTIEVYPGTLLGKQSITIKQSNTTIATLKFTINNTKPTYSNITSITNAEKAKYLDGSQRCSITNSIFTNNSSKTEEAIYIETGEINFYRQNNNYGATPNNERINLNKVKQPW